MTYNIYLISLIAPVITLVITKVYDKFEKKDYPVKTYVKLLVLSYVSTLASLYIAKTLICPLGSCPLLGNTTVTKTSLTDSNSAKSSTGILDKITNLTQGGGSNSSNIMSSNSGQVFHTGNPTF